MTAYSFDDGAATFHYFVLAVAGAAAVPITARQLLPRAVPPAEPQSRDAPAVAKRNAQKTRPSGSPLKAIGLAVLWIVVAWALRGAMTHRATAPKLYDPFEILGVATDAGEDAVKAAFKRLSRQFHPDKVAEDERSAAEARFVEIGKAYRALTDEVTRRNWEEHGNPDGIRTFALGVALPAWLVSSRFGAGALVLLYVAAFGLLLPFCLRAWWARHRVFTPSGVRHSTMHMLYSEMREGANARRVLELAAMAAEFADLDERPGDAAALEKLISLLKELSDAAPRRLDDLPFGARVALALLWAHVQRIDVPSGRLNELQSFVVERAHRIVVGGILSIAVSRDFYKTALAAMSAAQFLVAAVWEDDSSLLQLPYVTREMVRGPLSGVESIAALFDVPADDRRRLFPSLTDAQYDEVLSVGATFPAAHCEAISFSVLGQETITPGSVVTARVRIGVEFPAHGATPNAEGASSPDDSDSDDSAAAVELDEDGSLADSGSARTTKLAINAVLPPPIYCPRFPGVHRPAWWVAIVNRSDNGFVVDPVRVPDLVARKTLTMQLPAPSRPMAGVTLRLLVRADWGVGAGFSRDVRFSVVEAAPEDPAAASKDPWGIAGDDGDAVSFAD